MVQNKAMKHFPLQKIKNELFVNKISSYSLKRKLILALTLTVVEKMFVEYHPHITVGVLILNMFRTGYDGAFTVDANDTYICPDHRRHYYIVRL